MSTRDVFICHATGDKSEFVYPLVEALRNNCITFWLDEAEILWGDKITRKVNEGLSLSRYVIVFLTPTFLSRNWPQAELESALSLELSTSKTVVLPIVAHSEEALFGKMPMLRDKMYLRWENGVDNIVARLAVLLGREFKTHWVYSHPASYTGRIWIRVFPHSAHKDELHKYSIRWGPWKHHGEFFFAGRNYVSLEHAKGNDELSIPLFFTILPQCYVTFGQGESEGNNVMDINHSWTRV